MPRIPVYHRQTTKPSITGEAPLPLSIADTSAGAIGQGLQQLGAGVSNLGTAINREQQERRDIQDTISRLDSVSLMTGAEGNIATKMITDPDYNNWNKYVDEEYENLKSGATKLNMSDRERSLTNARLSVWHAEQLSRTRVASAQALVNTGQNTVLTSVYQAYAAGDEGNQKIADDSFELMKSSLWKNDVLAMQAYNIQKAKGMADYNSSQVEWMRNHASANPELTISIIDDEIADRTKGRGVFSKDALSDEDLTDIKAHANTVISAGKTAAKQAFEAAQETAAVDISGKVAKAKTYDERVNLIGDIESLVQKELIDRKVGEGYIRELRDGPDAPTDWSLVGNLKLDIDSVRDGKTDFMYTYNQIQSNRGEKLGKSEADSLTTQLLSAKVVADNKLPSVAQNNLKRFQRINSAYFNTGIYGDPADKEKLPEASAKFAGIGEALDRYVNENPQATEKEMRAFFDNLTKTDKESGVTKKLLKTIGRFFDWDGKSPGIDERRKLRELSAIAKSQEPLYERKLGTIKTVNNVSYVLVKLADDPAQDKWIPQE